uniref:Uncharacterized protein n=1 Tax=Panagrolaimus davidi TaxID=227884 RepID=A0A914PKH3_9BILA
MSQLLLSQGVGSSPRHLILDIHGDFFNPFVDSINISTGQVKNFQIEWKETDVFLGTIESSFDLTQVKAIVIRAMEYEVMTFQQSYAFRLKCKEFCEKHGIFYFVGNDIHLNALAAIIKTHTMVKEGEEVLIVMSKFMDLVFTVRLIREHDHYRYIGSRMLFTPMQLQIIFCDCKPEKVIILHNTEASEETKNEINEFLKEYNPILLHQGFNDELEKEGLIEKVFHLTGERKSVYDVGVSCSQAWFDVRLDKKCLINVIPNEVLPFEKTITINVDHAKTIGLFAKFEVIPYERLEVVKLSDFKTKRVKITLKIDINLLYEFTVDPIGPIVQPPSSFPKVRVVFYPKHFSVYLQYKNKESILEDFDGKFF